MRTKGKNYTKNEDLCENDSFMVIHNGELMAGTFDKNNVEQARERTSSLICSMTAEALTQLTSFTA